MHWYFPHYSDHNFGTKFPEGWVYVMSHISTRLIYELDILHFIAYYLLDFSRVSNFTYDVMGPILWSYYVYYWIVIMMLLGLWCHHDYNVAMFMQLWCVDCHRITVFYNDSICWNVLYLSNVKYIMWYMDTMLRCDQLNYYMSCVPIMK